MFIGEAKLFILKNKEFMEKLFYLKFKKII